VRDAIRRTPERSHRVPPWAVDPVLATLIVLVGLTTTGATSKNGVAYEQRDTLAWLLIAASTVPYFVRRRAPVAVYAVTITAIAALMLGGYDDGALPWVTLVGAYTVGAYRPAWVVVVSAGYTAVLLIVLLVGDVRLFGFGEFVAAGGAYGAAMLVGWTMQARRDRIDAFEEEQEEAARRAAADERLRIAQELHDVVAHSLGLIAVQAGVGIQVIDSDPAEAKRSLESISRASRSSLAEIRQVLGVLRDADGNAAYTPTPGLADLPKLVSEVSDAGLPVAMTVEGDTAQVPAGVGLAAYRVVQEALTNALRHARAGRATVRVDAADGLLQLEVTDDGRGVNGAASRGHGLVGMRERVAVYGGTIATGSAPEGGYRVAASLPYEAAPE